MNDITGALECTKYSAALIIDLFKAFDMVEHIILTEKLHRIGVFLHANKWFF